MSGVVLGRFRRHRNRLGVWGQGLRIAGSPKKIERIRLRRMLVDPVVVRSADRDQILDRVRSTLRTSQNVVRVDRTEASDLGDERSGSASSIPV